ncbi:serotransferrin-1-like isoform X2 [Pseudorasbora parva]|uniref:serotransferrin-1-like isoform X2 n=1 Tax=Pseudorasbora parva TaxID=51549 RepID=UPI00351F7469
MNILLISLLGCLVVALPSASAQKVKWCVKTQNELKKCKHLASKSADLECLLRLSTIDCIKSIEKGEADVVTADGEHVYFGGRKPFELRPLIAEKYQKESCYAVAVVKRDTDFSIRDLKGKTSYHSCYKSPGGWTLPIGRLVAVKIIPWDPNDMTLESAVSHFFLRSCVPGISKAQYPKLCSDCQGDCSCSQNEQCSGDGGAFQCMKKGNGDVAFICQDGIPEIERPNYQLLCMDGRRKSVEDYKTCNLGKEPHRAVIGRKDADSQHIYKVLKQIPGSDLFSSDVFGGKDLIFSDSAFDLMELPKITDSFLYLKDDYGAMHALREGSPPARAPDGKIQWCVISHAEQQKCDGLQIPRVECRRASSVEECIQKVMRREADFFAADGGQVYIAGKCGLVPAMVEQYDEQSCPDGGEYSSLFVVAVVRKDSGVTWNKLRGRKSCHTGLNHNAGWIVPDSVICGKTPDCTLYEFFSEGCAPGADPTSNMCKLCKGGGKQVGDESKCKASSEEMYYGYDGAFRCLAEGAGEVAFIKHSIVGDYTEGIRPDWAKDLKADEFELICPKSPDRTFKHTEFADCNLAKVPAHAVITRKDVRSDVVSVLREAQKYPDSPFKSKGERNLLFSDSTKCLQETTKPLQEFLTKEYTDMIERTYATGQGVPDLVKACTLDGSRDQLSTQKEFPTKKTDMTGQGVPDVVKVCTLDDCRHHLSTQQEFPTKKTDMTGQGVPDVVKVCTLDDCRHHLSTQQVVTRVTVLVEVDGVLKDSVTINLSS